MNKFHAGQRVYAHEAVDYLPYALIGVGSTGRIVDCSDLLGSKAIEIVWDKFHKGLACFDNKTILVVPELLCVRPVADCLRAPTSRILPTIRQTFEQKPLELSD